MRSRIANVTLLVLMSLSLAACGGAGTQATLAAGEESRMLGGGGGGVWTSSGYATPTEGLVVVGVGTASAEPEVAYITFGVDLSDSDAAQAVDDAAGRINRAIAAAQGLGIAAEDIRTTGYSLWVETIYDPHTSMPTGEVKYHVSHYVRATLRDLTRVGDLLAAVVGAGANTISEVSFSVEDTEALVEQARQEALADARTRAQTMAQALDISLGSPVLVTETSGGYMPMDGMGGGGMMVSAPVVGAGMFSVSVSVQVVYEIR